MGGVKDMEQAPLPELRCFKFPEAGAALQSAKATILARWRQSVSEIVQQADALTRRQLENSLPDMLDRLAAAMAAGISAPTDRLIAIAPVHGATRFHQEFSLNQLLVEYQVLRRIILQEMTTTLNRTLTIDESVAVNQGVDETMRQATIAFANHQTAKLKDETAAMSKFLSFLSHDLRGGLNGAVLMLEVLKRQLTGDPRFASALEDLDVVRRSILDTVATMERFLSAEKLRLGRMPVNTTEVNTRQVLEEAQKSLAYQAKDQGVAIEIDAPADLVVSSDRQLLALVLHNLISNALKYGRHKNVRVSAQRPDSPGANFVCRFSVADGGPGIAQEKLADLFTAFERGETYGQKGVGLGLYIARQAADLLKAKLWADSKLGEGSTFHLDLATSAADPA
jgi:signal transduction histidine kinase